MSQYERRRRSNVLSGDGSRLPNGGNTRVGQSGSGHLAAFSVCLGGRLDKTGTHANDSTRGEAVGKPGVAGVYTNQRLNLSKLGKVFDRKPRLQTGSVRINSGKEEEDVELGNLSSRSSGFDSHPVKASQPAGSESCMWRRQHRS